MTSEILGLCADPDCALCRAHQPMAAHLRVCPGCRLGWPCPLYPALARAEQAAVDAACRAHLAAERGQP